MNEEELIEGCCRNDRKAQEYLYNRYSGKLYVIALRYTKSQSEAEDVIQDSFIKVFDKIREFKRKSKLETWLTRIVINTALNSQRSKLYMFPMADVNEINLEDEISLARFEWQDLLKMIQSLPSGCQAIFNLFAIEGYNHNEIAEMLSISEGTSKSQYSRAKILLKELISKNEMVRYERA
ncbi:MAG TPA: RNA polymerase sigma factor [Cyclobacteriaceae bacterium]|jgi:RNA polymerase sigma-70 factor (ECF subfamily)